MARSLNKLTAKAVETLTKAGRYSDGGGLYLHVADGSRRRWVMRYTIGGKLREMGLGAASDVSLAQARRKAEDARRLVEQGRDPIKARDAALAEEAAEVPTFGAMADRYIASKRAEWRNKKHADQWIMTMKVYAKALRDKPVNAITTEDVLGVLDPALSTAPKWRVSA